MSAKLTEIVEEAPANGAASVSPWKDEFQLRGDLKQRDVYAFEDAMHTLGGFSRDGSNILAGHALKAAIEAGWVAEPPSEVLTDAQGKKRHHLDGIDVDDMHPGKVRWYGLRIVAHYSQAVAPPPN